MSASAAARVVVGAILVLCAVVTGQARAASAPAFVGTPSARYMGATIGVVVRLDRRPSRPSTMAIYAAPHLRSGQKMGSNMYGGTSLGAIGSPQRHCYLAEALQPRPRAQLRQGAHWRVGITVRATTLVDTSRVTLRTSTGDAWIRSAAKRLGCYA